MVKRLTIVLDDADADLLLHMAGSSRKQSEVLAGLIRAAAQQSPPAASPGMGNRFPDLEALALKFIRLESELAVLKTRLLALEAEHATN